MNDVRLTEVKLNKKAGHQMPGSCIKLQISDLAFLDYFVVDKNAAAIFADNDLLP